MPSPRRQGFRDSYREAYPDPVAKPGFTWTPGGPEDVKNEVHDRIDWVLVAGPAETVTSEIMGEKAYVDTDIAVDPFPSDHRGLVSTFEVSPVEPPAVISLAERRAEVGDSLTVRSYLPEGTGRRPVSSHVSAARHKLISSLRPARPSAGRAARRSSARSRACVRDRMRRC